jgi:hypothetical protein
MEEWRNRLGGRCIRCGATDDLNFHHRDPSEKSFTISRLWSMRDEIIETELAKCDLLCRECHKKHHESKATHGEVRRYWRGCRCGPCKEAARSYNRNLKRRAAPSAPTT